MSKRKSTARAKLKAANQEERIHFEHLLRKPPRVTGKSITKIINNQLDIKLEQFTPEELDSMQRKIKKRKAAWLEEIPPKEWKTKEFDDILLRHCNAVYNQNTINR